MKHYAIGDYTVLVIFNFPQSIITILWMFKHNGWEQN